MDKLTIATEVLLKLIETDKTGFDAEGIAAYAWEITDAMQAEAEKRENKERPDVLKEEWQPDWSQAPETAIAWKMQSKSSAVWIHDKSLSAFEYSIAPTFNYQGNWQDSLRKRPKALREVDWSQAPDDATHYVIFADGMAYWHKSEKLECFDIAPSFGITGMYVVERPL